MSREHVLSHRLARRRFLAAGALGGAAWLTPLARLLARQAEAAGARSRPQSVIVLWLAGGPSQLETFDPHPDTPIAAGSRAIDSALAGVQVGEGFARLAEQLPHLSLVRSLVSKEGDHARGTYLAKTGYNPDPTVLHPALGAICCHELSAEGTDIPRHVSILPDGFPARGGYLGAEYDAFQVGDPAQPVPDVRPAVAAPRFRRRLEDLAVVDRAFAAGRERLVTGATAGATLERALAMMDSEQLRAFDVSQEPAAVREEYGDTPFGRGCLAARRLIEAGVRAVEITLAGWDSHVNNHAIQRGLVDVLDPALAGLVADLRRRELWDRTLVLCLGEFGRTPQVNPLEGRDHWTTGFSLALGGGGLRPGVVWGATDPAGGREVRDPVSFADIHATVLAALGIDRLTEYISPAERPLKLSEGTPLAALWDEA